MHFRVREVESKVGLSGSSRYRAAGLIEPYKVYPGDRYMKLGGNTKLGSRPYRDESFLIFLRRKDDEHGQADCKRTGRTEMGSGRLPALHRYFFSCISSVL